MKDILKNIDRLFYVLLLIGMAMPVLYFDHSLYNYHVGKSSVFILITGFTGIYLLARRWNQIEWKFSYYSIAFFCYLASFALSYFFSVNKHITLWGSYEYQGGLVFIFAVFILVLVIRESYPFQFETILWAIICPAWIHSLVAILQSFHLLGATIHSGPAPEPWGLLGNGNISGNYIATVLPLCLAFVFHKEVVKKILGTIALAFLSFALYLSSCRGAQLGVFIGISSTVLLYFHIYKNKKYWIPVYALIALVIASTMLMLFLPEIFPVKAKLINFFKRYHAWKLSLGAIFEYPFFGNGYKNFPFAFYPLRTVEFIQIMHVHYHSYEYFFSPHNNYLETVIERGFFGFVAMSALFALGLYKLFRIVREKKNLSLVAFALFGSLISFLVWTFANWETLASIPTIFMILLLIDKLEANERYFIVKSKWIILTLMPVLVSFFVYIAYHQIDLYRADRIFALIMKGNIPNRVEKLEELIKDTVPPKQYFALIYAQLLQQYISQQPDREKKMAIAKRALSIIEPNVDIQFEPNKIRFLKYKFHQILDDVWSAEKTLNEILKLDPIHYTALTELAKIHLLVYGNDSKAYSLIQEALKLKENYLDANLMMAQFEIQSGRKVEATRRLEFMIKEYPQREDSIKQVINEIPK